MKSKKSKIITLSVLIIAIICSVIFAVGAADNTSEEYWKVVLMDVDDYRSDSNNLIAPEYDGSGEYIFAGWFTDKECTEAISKQTTTGAAYAKFVPADILGVKAQVNVELSDHDTTNDDEKEDGTNAGAIRFVTSVDSLMYSQIGFVLNRGGDDEVRSSNKVYKQLYVTGEAQDGSTKTEEYVPSNLFNAASEYFKTWTYTKMPSSAYDTDITVTPFWKTLDGTTVKGTTSVKCVNMGRQWKYIFVDDNTGSDTEGTGTRGCPYATLNGALAHIQEYGENEGGQVWILDSFTAASDFSWDEHGLDVTIKGDTVDTTNSSTISFASIGDLKMGDAATIESIDLTFNTDTLYANGHRLEIAQSVTTTNAPKVYGGSTDETVESTNVALYTGSYANIYAGGEGEDVSGDTYMHIGGNVDASTSNVYAGSYQATVSGDTCVIVDGNAKANYVFAGANGGTVLGDTYATIGGNATVTYVRGGGNGSAQVVEGTCYVTIVDNPTITGVNGGGANGSTNNTYVVVKGGTISQVLGGQTSSGGNVNNSNVHILGGTITRRVYGGSYNDYSSLAWQSTNSVAGHSSVTISAGANISNRSSSSGDTSICAVSRAESNLSTEIGVMILNYGVSNSNVGFSSDMEWITDAIYTHFLVNVGEGGMVTSESDVLRIAPDNSLYYATVKDASGNVLFQCQGEGTYSLSGLAASSSLQTITVTFSETISETLSGNYVLSYGDDSYSYFNTLSDALAAVSTPSVSDTIATITIYEENVAIDSTFALTDDDKVILKNADDKNVTITRTTGNTMFNIAYGCSLTIDGTIVVDGNKDNSIVGPTLVMNEGTFTLEEGATLQNAATEASSNSSSDNGAALYNTGNSYIYGTVTGNKAYYGGAVYNAGGTLTLYSNSNASFENNTSADHAGAIYMEKGILNADGYTFVSNSAQNNYGGAIYIGASGESFVYNCTFGQENAGNSSKAGGAILVAGSLVADNCTFNSNTSSTSGGAVCVYETSTSADASLIVTNSTFINNKATQYNGAIDINGGGDGVDGTNNIQIRNCSFEGNSSTSGGTIGVRRYGAKINISDLAFTGDASENTNVIYILQPSNAVSYESVAVSGVIENASIYISSQPASKVADENKSPIVINGRLSSESDITVETGYSYVEGIKLVTKLDDTVSDLTFKNAIKVLDLTQVSGNYWFIDSTGCLSQVSAIINGTEGSYADALAAIAAGGSVEVQFTRDVEIADTITIPTGADVTITNASDTKVTLTRATTSEMFNVEADAKLTLGSEDSAKAFIIDGADLSGDSLIKNAGTFSSNSNITIKNANAGSNNGGVLYNTGTAILTGTYTNNTASQGAVVYNTGTVTVKDGTYSYNIATSGGGVIYSNANASVVNIEAGLFEYNEAQGGTSGVIYGKATVTITGGTFQYNKATSGGAIMNVAGSCEATIKNATIIENSLTATTGTIYNGAIYVSGKGILNLEDCNIYNNNSHYRSLTNPGCDVSLGANVTLNLKDNSNVGVVQQRYNNEVATINIVEAYTGSVTLLPYNDVFTIGSTLIIFDETLSDTEKTTSVGNIVVRDYVSSASDYTDDMYCVDTDGLLQYKNAEAKVGTITYLTLAEAVTAATSGDTVYVLRDIELSENIAIGNEETTKDITITNATGKDVTITRTLGYTMFTVASNSSLNISCSSEGTITLDGNRDAGVVGPTLILNAGTFTLGEGVTLQNTETKASENSSDESGAALYNTGIAYIHGNIMKNHAYAGGAIYSDGGSVELSTSIEALISNNTTAKVGGAIYLGNSAELNAEGYVFSDNVAGTNGGVIGINSAIANFDECTFEDNQTGTGTNIHGGVAYVNGTFNVDNCTFSNNIADDNGGVLRIYTSGSSTSAASVSNSIFSGNVATKGNVLSVSGSTQVNVSDCTFTENSAGEKQAIYLENSTPQLNISGKLVGGMIANLYNEQLVINGEVSKESDITITPNSYTEGTQILTVGDTMTSEELAKAANIISVTPNDEGEWYISHEGMLLPVTVKAQVGTTYYTDVDEAIEVAIAALADADSTATVYVLNDTSMDTGVEITTGTLVVTNAPGKDVELTRALEDTLFTVSADAALQIGADAIGTLVIDGGYDSEDTENSIVAPAVVTNAGTFTLGKNAAIQNAYTAVTKSDALYNGAALLNTGLAYVYGDFENTYGYNGGAVWNYGGTMHVYEGNYINNTSVAAGGAIYNSGTATLYIYDGYFYQNVAETGTSGAIYGGGTVTITGGTYSNNKAATGGAVLNVAGTAIVSGTTMNGNTLTATSGSTFYGGAAIYVGSSKTLTLSNSTIYNNTSSYDTKVPSCDIRFGNATAFSNSSISGININSTDYCYIYHSSTKYYIDSDGNTLIEVE